MKRVIAYGAFLVVLGIAGIGLGVFTTHQMPFSGGVLGVGVVLLIVGVLSRG